MKLKASIAIPYRDSDGSRAAGHQKALSYISELGYSIRIHDSDPGQPFNRAQARNNAVRDSDDDVIIICDADSVPEAEPLKAAVEGAFRYGVCHFPFDVVRDLDSNGTEQSGFPTPLASLSYLQEYGPSQGGCWVIRPDCWWKAGGQDERLTGWGQEDRAFLVCTMTLLGRSVSLPGRLYTMHHRRSGRIHPEDLTIFNQYNSLYGDVVMLRRYLHERGSYEESRTVL